LGGGGASSGGGDLAALGALFAGAGAGGGLGGNAKGGGITMSDLTQLGALFNSAKAAPTASAPRPDYTPTKSFPKSLTTAKVSYFYRITLPMYVWLSVASIMLGVIFH
jgi:hypothetical protein